MGKIIGVRFKSAGKIYYFDGGEHVVEIDDHVIVETTQGVELGKVVCEPCSTTQFEKEIKTIIRVASQEDHDKVASNKKKCEEAFDVINKHIVKHNLDMKVIDIEYTFDNGKMIFYFAAEERVDFRELVKDLATIFKTRIELRQIGVRDETKSLGGLGPCGRVCCCNAFLGDFSPVSIKMAKEQNLSLSPTKISGLCGRLMCCLNYEQELYEQSRKKLPRVGMIVSTPDGKGEVLDINVLSQLVKTKIELPDKSFEARFYPVSELKWDRKQFREQKSKDEQVLIDQE